MCLSLRGETERVSTTVSGRRAPILGPLGVLRPEPSQLSMPVVDPVYFRLLCCSCVPASTVYTILHSDSIVVVLQGIAQCTFAPKDSTWQNTGEVYIISFFLNHYNYHYYSVGNRGILVRLRVVHVVYNLHPAVSRFFLILDAISTLLYSGACPRWHPSHQ